MLARDGKCCSQCSTENEDPSFFHVDRIVPLNHGGSDTAANCQVLCPNCHVAKTLAEKSRYKKQTLKPTTVTVRKARDIGDVIRLVRESRCMSQEELAYENAYDRFYLSRLETGSYTLYLTRLLRTLKFLRIRLVLIYGEEEKSD